MRSDDSPGLGAAPEPDALELKLVGRRALAAVMGTQPEPLEVGRFILDEPLASGGMGTVWRARDPELDRPLAIKFMREAGGELGERRMLEEAQALAKVSHPNVVPIFDVGRHEGRVWVAMEFVPGRTLRAWVEDEAPGPKQRLAAWIDAGRGLAAVHALGLVHRDVKPDNVLMGEDGRVRLIDFGLVRGVERRSGSETSEEGAAITELSDDGLRTRTGQFLGTRAYAAPEQLAGAEVDARADQYALCVSIWEALLGRRPADAPGDGRPLALESGERMARRVRAALSRGLARDPERRYASMEALLDALAPRRRAWILPATALALPLSIVSSWALFAGEAPAPVDPCADTGAALERALAEHPVDAALAGLPASQRSLARVAVHEWSRSWRAAAERSCEEVHVEHLRSAASLDTRRACLDRRLDELGVVLELGGGHSEPGPGLLPGLAQLEDPRACLDDRRLGASEPASASESERARELHRQLFSAWVGARNPDLHQRRAEVERLQEEAQALGDREELAFAKYARAGLALLDYDAPAARQAYGELLDLADVLEREDLRVQAWHGLANTALDLEQDHELARWCGARERVGVRRLEGQAYARERGLASLTQAHLALDRGALDEAEVEYRAALEQLRAAGPATSALQATTLHGLARVVSLGERHDEARALVREAAGLEGDEGSSLGEAAGEAAFTRGERAWAAGELDEAVAAYTEALAAYEAVSGPHGEDVADTQLALARVEVARGELDGAWKRAVLADGIYRSAQGFEHPGRASALSVMGNVAYWRGDMQAAVDAFALSLEILERGEDPEEIALARANLGEVLHELGREAAAEPILRAALESLTAQLGPEHSRLAVLRKALGATLLARGRPDEARVLLERALAQFEADAQNPIEQAQTRWELARALGALDEHLAAHAQAQRAADEFEALGPEQAGRVREINTWLRGAAIPVKPKDPRP